MHGFWTLVKAEFTVEVISKLLFSGRFPRGVAYLLTVVFLGWFLIVQVLKCIRAIYRIVFVTKRQRVKKHLKSVFKQAKTFGDAPKYIANEPRYVILKITGIQYRRNIESIVLRVDIQTEQLDVRINRSGVEQSLPYETIRYFCTGDIHLHGSYAPKIYSELRLNLL